MPRELNYRNTSGIEVTLWYDSENEGVFVTILQGDHELTSDLLPGHLAKDAFAHPFCYVNRPTESHIEDGVYV